MSDLDTPDSQKSKLFLFIPLNILWSLATEIIMSNTFSNQFMQVWRWGITLFEIFLKLNADASLTINQKRDLIEQTDNFIHCNQLGPTPIAFRIALRNCQPCNILFQCPTSIIVVISCLSYKNEEPHAKTTSSPTCLSMVNFFPSFFLFFVVRATFTASWDWDNWSLWKLLKPQCHSFCICPIQLWMSF